MATTIRDATVSDGGCLDGVVAITMSGRSPDEREAHARTILSEATLVLVAIDTAAASTGGDERPIGVVALTGNEDGSAVITALAVLPAVRGRGVGRSPVRAAGERFAGSVTAETDRAAEGFYRSLGFEVRSIGFPYPDVERFACVLR